MEGIVGNLQTAVVDGEDDLRRELGITEEESDSESSDDDE